MSEEILSRRQAVGLAAATAALAVAGTAEADQPNMRKALQHLRKARNALQRARSNKDGHRRDALELVNRAINQTEKGIRAGG